MMLWCLLWAAVNAYFAVSSVSSPSSLDPWMGLINAGICGLLLGPPLRALLGRDK